jgi:hypothetical protein
MARLAPVQATQISHVSRPIDPKSKYNLAERGLWNMRLREVTFQFASFTHYCADGYNHTET